MSWKQALGLEKPTPLETYLDDPDDPTNLATLVEEEPKEEMEDLVDKLALVPELNQSVGAAQSVGYDNARERDAHYREMSDIRLAHRGQQLRDVWFGLGGTTADTAYGVGDFGRNAAHGTGRFTRDAAVGTVDAVYDVRDARADRLDGAQETYAAPEPGAH